MLIPVILCGGAGSRLWPASRDGFPKPFIALPDGDTLIAKTIRRARRVAPNAPLLIVTGAAHGFLIGNALKALDDTGSVEIMLEPMGRNTAPAVAVAALWVQQNFGDTARILVLAADHHIENTEGFAQSVQSADAAAQAGALVTFGITPTSPEIGYGYLEQGTAVVSANHDVFQVKRFIEKPPLAQAQAYVASGTFAWNSGMFCFAVGTLLAEMAKTAPQVLETSKHTLTVSKNVGNEIKLDAESFARCPSISVDYAVMEKASNVAMVRAAFDWSDIGAWPAMAKLVDADDTGNRGDAQHHFVDSANVFIESRRTVAAIGLNNVVIVDSADAVLVAHADHAQSVKRVVDTLKSKNSELTKLHMTVHRPWGTYTILEDGDDCKVKRITVNPGASLSLQSHFKRSEHWVVVAGTATITNGEKVLTMRPGEATFIPVETKHRLENKTNEMVAIIETQVGTYFGEDDIVRYEDIYGRTA